MKPGFISAKQKVDDQSPSLASLLQSQKTVKDYRSIHDLLMQRYFAHISYIDRVAQAYGEIKWYVKLSLLLAIMSLFVAVTLLIHLSILFIALNLTVISAGLFTHFILHNHDSLGQATRKMICDDIRQLEHDLQTKCQQLQDIEAKIQHLFQTYFAYSRDLSLKNATMGHCLETLEQLVAGLCQHADEVGAQNKLLTQSNHRLMAQMDELNSQLVSVRDELAEKSKQLSESCEQLAGLTNFYNKSLAELSKLSNGYQTEVTTLGQLNTLASKMIATLPKSEATGGPCSSEKGDRHLFFQQAEEACQRQSQRIEQCLRGVGQKASPSPGS